MNDNPLAEILLCKRIENMFVYFFRAYFCTVMQCKTTAVAHSSFIEF